MLQEHIGATNWDSCRTDVYRHNLAVSNVSRESLFGDVPREKTAEVMLWRMGNVVAVALGIAVVVDAVLLVLHIG